MIVILEEKMNDINYKKTVKKLHDAGWEKSYFTSADVSIIGYEYNVSQNPKFYAKYLYMYQVLPRPYKGSYDGFTGDKLIKKWVLELASQAEIFVRECIETRSSAIWESKYLSGNVLKLG